MRNLLILLFVNVMLFSAGCKSGDASQNDQKNSDTPFVFGLPDWAKSAVIYEVNTRQFSPEGNFKGVENQLDRLKDMGIDILWLMPLHPISELKRKATGDILVKDIKDEASRAQYYGSPYAVADYKEVNPDYGSMEDFKSLLAACHKKGLKLIIEIILDGTTHGLQLIQTGIPRIKTEIL